MLETVHTFASDLLQSSGEMDEMRRRHASYFVDFVERAAPELRGGGQQMTWMRALESEHANLRAALRWAFEQGEFEVGQRLVAGLGNFWHRQGHWSEGERWVALALERVDMAPKDLQAAVYFAAGSVAFSRRDPGHGQRMFHRAKELYRELGARRMLGWSMVLLAVGSVGNKAEYEEATETCQEGMRLLREVGDMSGLAQGYNAIGELSRAVGKSEQAKSAYLKTLDIAREMGDGMRVAMNLCNLSFLALEEGDARRARRLLLEGMRVFDDQTSRPHLICSLASQSGSLAALGEFDRAAKLLGASDQLLERYGLTLQPADVPVIAAYRRAVIKGMSDEAYAAAYEAGRTLSLEEAVALAEDTA
jgi:tetratricopeptide (TPR) repeat protein